MKRFYPFSPLAASRSEGAARARSRKRRKKSCSLLDKHHEKRFTCLYCPSCRGGSQVIREAVNSQFHPTDSAREQAVREGREPRKQVARTGLGQWKAAPNQ